MVTFQEQDTRVDIILQNMLDFDTILCMYWLGPHHAVLDCYVKIVTLVMPGIPILLRHGLISCIPIGIISYTQS